MLRHRREPGDEAGMERQRAADARVRTSAAGVEEVARVLALHPIFGRFDTASLAAVAAPSPI
jgi:hypothetical protein